MTPKQAWELIGPKVRFPKKNPQYLEAYEILVNHFVSEEKTEDRSPKGEQDAPTLESNCYLMTVKEAAKKYRMSQTMICQLCRDRRLAHIRVGREGKRGRIFIEEKDMKMMLKRFRVEVHPLLQFSESDEDSE
jgi:hypothetical protein